MLAGLLNKQIADELGLALVTVKYHRGSAMRKLGARTAAELARIVRELGLPWAGISRPLMNHHQSEEFPPLQDGGSSVKSALRPGDMP
jgi:hypothetical protein